MEKYYAKSPNSQGQMETVQHHLLRTGELCSAFLSVLGWKDVGEILGKLHDFGKYSILFQQVLKGLRVHVNHAYPGAALALNSYGQGRSQTAKMMAMAIAAHHSQLNQDCLDTLRRLMRGEGDREDSCGNSLSLFGREEMQQSALLFRQELSVPRLASSLISSEEENTPLSRMLCARFLLSALADADYSSSAEHNDPDYLSTHTGSEFNAAAALERLMELRRQKQKNSTASGPLNRLRDQLFEDCLTAAQQPPGIFRLTAPTGLGKTLSLFAFAAQHCQLHKKRRVILVLPFLAVTEQNGRDYSAVEPRLLESHSAAELSEEARGWSERWSAPCIVTTNVGFFEPLFSAKPTACRRLHQIANSVIVLDEAQSLPSHLLDATLRTLQTLCRSYGCTVVLSTATQPSFEYLPNINWTPREIVPNPQHLFQVTQRVAYHWRIDRPTPLSQIAAELSEKNCGCASSIFALMPKAFIGSFASYAARKMSFISAPISVLLTAGWC